MRALKLALLILALLPAVYCHAPKPPPVRDTRVALVDLMPALRTSGRLPDTGALQLVGAWQLRSGNSNFGNFSGLAQTGGDFVTVGDRGGVLWFARDAWPQVHSKSQGHGARG